MNNETVTELSETDLETTLGGMDSSTALAIGGGAVAISLGVLCAPVAGIALVCWLAGAVGVIGDGYVMYGVANAS